MNKYISAKEGPGISVIYTDSKGNLWKFDNGTRTWRNNNPGNLVPGKVSKRNNAIGKAGGFAVFPDYESGHAALLDSLKNVHGTKDIDLLMHAFAPPHENDTAKYISFLRKKTGVKSNKKILDFTPEEFEKLWRAIEQMEGWKEGTITPYDQKGQIQAVRKNSKGTIQSYLVASIGWISKGVAIKMARSGQIDAVIATSPRGNLFLRSRPNKNQSDNLRNKG